jgi:hypothetical protein
VKAIDQLEREEKPRSRRSISGFASDGVDDGDGVVPRELLDSPPFPSDPNEIAVSQE